MFRVRIETEEGLMYHPVDFETFLGALHKSAWLNDMYGNKNMKRKATAFKEN